MPAEWTEKQERKYAHIVESERDSGASPARAKEIAARTMNKERARSGQAQTASRSSTDDVSSSHRGGVRVAPLRPARTDEGAASERGAAAQHRRTVADVQGRARARRRQPASAPELAQTVGDVMSAPIVTAPESPLTDAVHVMVAERTGALPVVADGRSGGDPDRPRHRRARSRRRASTSHAACVGDVASSGLVYVRPEQPVGHALLVMAAHQLRRLPVVDDSLRVVGTITQVDIARSPTPRRCAKRRPPSLKPPGLLPISRGNGERSRRRR